jgi:hypothetical protein
MHYYVPGDNASAANKRSPRYWLICILTLFGFIFRTIAVAQSLITQPLPYSALCAGAQVDVTGAQNNLGTDWTVELSNGGTDYYTIPSTFLSASGRFEATYRATIPANTPAGNNYRIRVVSKNPALNGTPSSTVLTIYASVPTPIVAAVSYCQGAQATPLSAIATSGGMLNWYTSSTGGQSSAVGPTPSTTNAGTINYYVSQTVQTGCESSRATLAVTVNAIPSAPTVSPSSYTFCQNVKADPLSASGENLKWYETATGGTGVGGIVPNTASAGAKQYYVSQTVKGCESARTSLAVTTLETPAAPSISQTSYEFCQGVANATITGTVLANSQVEWVPSGNAPKPNTTSVNSTTALATVPTDQVRTLTYTLTQTGTNGCKSPASAQITIAIKSLPNAPVVQAVGLCQSAPAQSLSATGQNLLWYISNTGGTGSSTAPIVSTSQTGQNTYYVSQSASGCEGPRAALTVTVNAIPGVPSVANTAPTYCQNATANSLSATGQNLNWYRESSGGTSLGSSFTPDTKTAGNFTYYVSQSVNGCESSRSSITVKVTAQPTAPSVTSAVSYCQNTPTQSLTASGSSLKWYNSSGGGIDAPTPSTNSPGTTTYFVTQTVDGCEGVKAQIGITIKSTPGAPGTTAFSVCQNTPAQSLSATGQNLAWYTAATGGTGSTTSPIISTSQAGQTTYYVSQQIEGCEGPRATLDATVKPLPAAPAVSTKNLCQFATPELVSAPGDNLTWYSLDDTKLGSAPLINTDRGATFTVKVSQTVNGCEGPKATLVVNVLTTPAPTVSTPVVELCQGATSQPLSATGTNLKWTDPTGNIGTNAPAPSTTTPTAKADGDVYYVTQTGTNGCESPKVAIRVFIQTVPTMSISGSTTTNLGLEVPLQLTFTGVGPYRYKLSTGLAGTATKDTTISVLPTRTTTYEISEVSNKCGVGKAGSGSTATIAVLIPGIQTLALGSSTICAGASLATNFMTTGTFNPGSVFKLQLAKVESDTAKISFVDVPNSQASGGRILGTIPANLPAGSYWVRVMATNPKIPINGNISPTVLTVRPLATASLAGNQSIFDGQPASLSVTLTGDGPWSFSYRDSTASGPGQIQTIQATTNPYLLEVRPQKTTSYYLTSLTNVCGTGTRTNDIVVVTVVPLLGIEDPSLSDAISVYPVPATTVLTVQITGISAAQPALVELTDLTGRTTTYYETRQVNSQLTLDQHAAGTYILRVRVGDRTASRRIVKL